jgi:hypothetical protein
MAVVKDQRYFRLWFGEVIEPSLLERAKNFTVALTQHIVTGRKRVSEQVYELRLLTCQECIYFDSSKIVCKHSSCGCRLKIKARWASSGCPIKLWEGLGDGNE